MLDHPQNTSEAGQAGAVPLDVVLVTGPAGAGRTTAIHVLDDLGFEAIDNLPISLLERMLDGPPLTRPLVVGIDPRTRDFSPSALLAMVAALGRRTDVAVQLLYIDCRADILLQRFSETRRRHPSAPEETPRIGIERELLLMQGIRDCADILIDTSDLTPHDLRSQLVGWFSRDTDGLLALSVQSFSYKRGAPRDLDMILDPRFLRNPHWEKSLRPLDGRDADVGAYITADDRFLSFLQKLDDITSLLLPAYKAEGKSYFSIGFGCTGGQHRSVFVTETFAKGLAEQGWQVSIRHRELERAGRL